MALGLVLHVRENQRRPWMMIEETARIRAAYAGLLNEPFEQGQLFGRRQMDELSFDLVDCHFCHGVELVLPFFHTPDCNAFGHERRKAKLRPTSPS